MILKIIINILLSMCLFFEIISRENSMNILRYSILMSLICISISLYILSDLKIVKKHRERILLGNGIYIVVASLLFNPLVVLIGPIVSDYIKSKKYSEFYICILLVLSVILQVKLGLSYLLICLGIVVTMFTYESVKNQQRREEIEKNNYILRDKIHSIEEKRLLEKKLNLQNIESIKIEERNLISQKIHDNIGHTLAGSIMQLEAVKIVVSKDVSKGIDIIDNIANNLREGMDEIRQALRNIKPEQSQIGINQLRLILDEFSKENKIYTEIKLEGDINDISVIYWRAITDTVKESLTNTIKHSDGDNISIEISVLNKIVRLFIKDNGSNKSKFNKGMGLLGIEERVVNLGGDVSFNNGDGFSTLIILKR